MPTTHALSAIPKSAKKFIDGVADMKMSPDDVENVYLARFLIQCTLPHSDPGDVPIWTRKNNSLTLAMQPGFDLRTNRSLGYPYGIVPRLLLIWIVTEAKRTRNRQLDLGHSLSAFMREVGLDPTSSGKRSDKVRLKDAAKRLFAARMSFHHHSVDGQLHREYTDDMQVAPKRELWWDQRDGDQAVLWGSWILLGESFYEAIMESTVPCDMRALRLLKKSPLALDLYTLCNWIGANLQKPKHFISWKMLGQQMGVNYHDSANLKKKVKAAMVKVKMAHPGLNVSYAPQGGGIVIYPSLPAIPRKIEAASNA